MKKELLVWDLGKLMIIKAYQSPNPEVWLINNGEYRKIGNRFYPNDLDNPIYEIISETVESLIAQSDIFI